VVISAAILFSKAHSILNIFIFALFYFCRQTIPQSHPIARYAREFQAITTKVIGKQFLQKAQSQKTYIFSSIGSKLH